MKKITRNFNDKATRTLQTEIDNFGTQYTTCPDTEWPKFKSVAKDLIDQGADPDVLCSTSYDFSLLTIAIHNEDLDFTKYLINNDADVLLGGSSGYNSLKACLLSNSADIASEVTKAFIKQHEDDPSFIASILDTYYKSIDWHKGVPTYTLAASANEIEKYLQSRLGTLNYDDLKKIRSYKDNIKNKL
jgi:hypothetical protein